MDRILRVFSQSPRPLPLNRAEGGYLLASMAVLLLIVIAVLSSYSFVTQRDARFKSNYAIGQHLADLSVMAHNFSQNAHFGPGALDLDGAGELFTPTMMAPPDGFAFTSSAGTKFEAHVRGRNAAPVTGNAQTFRAPSAYIHLKIRGGMRSATDMIALLSGAGSHGLDRVGIVKRETAPNAICDTVAIAANETYVIWGSESTACLHGAQLTAVGFTDVQPGDIIIPAWETAIGRANGDALFRFPQPERPDTNMMQTDLAMNNKDLTGIDLLEANDLNASDITINTLNVRKGTAAQPTATHLNNGMIATQNVQILNQSGPNAMTVNGNVQFNVDTMNVADTLQKGASMNVVVNDPNTPVVVSVNKIDNVTAPMTIDLQDLSGGTIAKRVTVANVCDPGDPSSSGCTGTSTISKLNFTNATPRLNITDTFNTNSRPMTLTGGNAGIYAAQMTTTGSAQIVSDNGPLDWNVGALNQTGSGQFELYNLQVNQDCIGLACPTNVTSVGGGF